MIVCDDAIDLDEAVQIAHDAIFFNHGQNCCAGSRTFVQAGIYDKFVAKAKAKADGRTVGNPWTEVDQGPQVCTGNFFSESNGFKNPFSLFCKLFRLFLRY